MWEDDDTPTPPYPHESLEKIGLFFFYFSEVEEYVHHHLRKADWTDEEIAKETFQNLIKKWHANPLIVGKDNEDKCAIAVKLQTLNKHRNAVAHSCWHHCMKSNQLTGHFQSREGKLVRINGHNDLDKMIRHASHCVAIFDFF